MIVRKTGKEKWHYSGQMAWALKRHAEHDVDKIEWSIMQGELDSLSIMRKFKAEFSSKGVIVYRISGKAVLVGKAVQLLISDRIDY